MQVQILYRDGSQRIVNLHPLFFSFFEVSQAERLSAMAYDGGYMPFKITLRDGSTVKYERIIPRNQPPYEIKEVKVDERKVKKDLRREFKGKPFKFCSPRLSYANYITE